MLRDGYEYYVKHVEMKASDSRSYRPIYDLALATEHVRLAQAHHALQVIFRSLRNGSTREDPVP